MLERARRDGLRHGPRNGPASCGHYDTSSVARRPPSAPAGFGGRPDHSSIVAQGRPCPGASAGFALVSGAGRPRTRAERVHQVRVLLVCWDFLGTPHRVVCDSSSSGQSLSHSHICREARPPSSTTVPRAIPCLRHPSLHAVPEGRLLGAPSRPRRTGRGPSCVPTAPAGGLSFISMGTRKPLRELFT